MAKPETVKKGAIIIVASKKVEMNDKQGIKRKIDIPLKITANAFSSVQWYGVKIKSGNDYYIKKAVNLGAEVVK